MAEKWTLHMNEHWPFVMRLDFGDGSGSLCIEREACSTAMVSLDDLRSGFGFPLEQRAEISATIRRQEERARLIAAAPRLAAALMAMSIEAVFWQMAGDNPQTDAVLKEAADALTEALGEAALSAITQAEKLDGGVA